MAGEAGAGLGHDVMVLWVGLRGIFLELEIDGRSAKG